MGTSFYLYLAAIWKHWWAFMMAGPLVLDECLRWISPRSKAWLDRIDRRKRRRFEIGLMLAGIFLAGFLAWEDEHEKLVTALVPGQHERHLTPQQKDRLRAALVLPVDENHVIEFNSVPNCEECEDYAEEFREFISSLPGWKSKGSTLIFSRPYERGLKLFTSSDYLANKLTTAFDSASISLPRDPERSSFAAPTEAIIVVARRTR